jgi:sugar (pentulose or hexulose) kinase
MGHGGFFKSAEVGQKIMSSALGMPVSVMSTAGEGGPWGMALLAAFAENKTDGETLEQYLEEKVFNSAPAKTVMADKADIEGYNSFLEQYKRGLPILRAATENL